MFAIAGYTITEQLYESAHSVVYRGYRGAESHLVVLKVLRNDYPTPQELARFRREYETTRSLDIDGVIHVYTLEPYKNTLVMVLEDFGGESLTRLLPDHPLTLSEFLRLAIRITEILGHIHQQQIMHKDINPSNIIWNPETAHVKIIDFGIASKLELKIQHQENPEQLEGTLAYVSPEQTGRMNRVVDYRTDLYSLGVTFYEMLTGQLPFTAEDAVGVVHAHIARQPVPPHEINPNIPSILSEIILKLMAKNAEDRYQSAYGLRVDLEWCLQNLANLQEMSDFHLGRQDFSDKFQISQKLYGREREIDTLLNAFDRIRYGATEMMLITGAAGIGKSSLINETHKPIVEKCGYFISGKFDQFTRNIPYSALIQAFQGLFRQLLTESEEQMVMWKDQLLKTLEPNAQIMIEVIPEVELIIGPQPPVSELHPAQAQNRFNFVFQNFIRIFAAAEHPLVIFLDDLQWIDSPSLKLIELFMTDPGMKYMLIVGAYRNNEVNATHPLMSMLNDIHNAGTTVNTILLNPLKLENVNQLIADTFKLTLEPSRLLAELSLQKTDGNPFFLTQFLQALYENRLLEFDVKRGVWTWESSKIQKAGITANVVELMVDRIQKLPERTQHVLKLAACIGNLFDLHTLSIVNENSQSEIADNLWGALQEGLIVPLDDSYKYIVLDEQKEGCIVPHGGNFKFLHDRVQQAAYSLIEEGHKQEVHLKIGRLLLSGTSEIEREEKLFEIVNHLNLGKDLILNQTEKDRLAELNLTAGKKAKASAAYQAAFNYLQVGIALLKDDSWQQHYEITLALYVEVAELAYLNGEFEYMEQLIKVVLQHAKTLLDKVKVYEVNIEACMAQNKTLEAVRTALQVLKLLGIRLPRKPNRWHVLFGLIETRMALAGKHVEALSDFPKMTDPYKLAAMRILAKVTLAANLSTHNFFPLMVFKQVTLSLKYGNTSESASAYAWYGVILCRTASNFMIKRDPELGYRFGTLALNLVERGDAKGDQAKVLFIVNNGIRHWKEHCRNILHPLLEGYYRGLEIGDFTIAAAAQSTYLQYSFYVGKELTGLEQKIRQSREVLYQIKHERYLLINALHRQVILNLMGHATGAVDTSPPYRIIGESYNEETILPLHWQGNDSSAICVVYLYKLLLAYLFQEYAEAVDAANIFEELQGIIAMVGGSLFHFYDSLSRIAIFHDVSKPEQKRILKKVAANQKKMKQWARDAPMNYLHKFYLVEAELARVFGKDQRAMEYYDKAIALAREYEYINEEALANELTANFYLISQKEKIAQTYIREARYYYLKWGAIAKVQDLDRKYPQLLITPQKNIEATSTLIKIFPSIHTTGMNSRMLDLSTLMKASQTIAGEIVLEKLLAKMVHIVMENAGAQKVFLILEKGNRWYIEAEGIADKADVKIMRSISIENTNTVMLSGAIVNYVIRTREHVVLDDAFREGSFNHDDYITTHYPKSILCLPLINQGRLIGILYLENNLVTGAFTLDHLEVLNLLSSQMAIALENAKLYGNLEQKVTERTHELEIEKEKLRESERHAQQLKEAAEDARKTAEKANQAKSEFLSHMSHELRTPLTAILGYTQLLGLDNNLIDKQREAIATIHRSGEHLLSLINGLLDLAKIEARKIDLNPVPVHLPGFLKSLVEMTRIHAQQKDITFTAEIPPDLPVVLVDEQRLRQILLNLLNNAMKFTEQGSVTLRVRRGDGEIGRWGDGETGRRGDGETGRRGDGEMGSAIFTLPISPTPYLPISPSPHLHFEVEDTGIGIPPQHLRDILLPFHQVENAQTKREGTGLGLAISQQLVHLMGGELHVKSTVGQGTTFWFDLQLPETEPDPILSALLSGTREKTTKVVTTTIDAESPENPSHQGLEGYDSSLVSECKVPQVSDESDLQVVPPQEILIELMESARDGRITNLRQVIATLKTLNPRLLPFATRIEHLTENFQFGQIVEWLNTLIQETT